MQPIRSPLIALLLVLLMPLTAFAENGPIAVVNSFHATLLEVMKNAQTLGSRGRYDRLDPELRKAFDFKEMIRLAAGSSWNGASESERSELSEAFTRMSVATYAAQFSGHAGETFETIGQREGPRGTVLVDTRLVRPNDAPVLLTYVLAESEGKWRIVNVLLDQRVSQLALRRAEYGTILREGGPARLIDELNKMTDRLLAS